jgi:LmbE family N-acetylglucosaminyl deacetylase
MAGFMIRRLIKAGAPYRQVIGLKKVLALGAHPDDIELGCAATIHKFIRTGKEVKSVIFTDCHDAVPKGWPKTSLREEARRSMKVLGVSNVAIYNFPNKRLLDKRQEILDLLYAFWRDWPELVLVPSMYNSHQDHIVVTEEAKRAFRGISIFGYAHPHSDYGFASDAIYSSLTHQDAEAKLRAIKEYKSQFVLKRSYFDLDYLRATMMAYGGEIGIRYAEKFQTIREIV